jgi:hypothetical protein
MGAIVAELTHTGRIEAASDERDTGAPFDGHLPPDTAVVLAPAP